MIDRRTFVAAAAGLLAWPFESLAALGRPTRVASLPKEIESALAKSGFVYVSPLRSDGQESTCHGEVWYGWIDGSVLLITAADRWKSRSVKRGLDTAKIWVGDYGRWKKLIGKNEAFREGPSFVAKASFVENDMPLLDRLLAIYEQKYPDEIADWRDRMRNGYRDGSRVLIRYVPDTAAPT